MMARFRVVVTRELCSTESTEIIVDAANKTDAAFAAADLAVGVPDADWENDMNHEPIGMPFVENPDDDVIEDADA